MRYLISNDLSKYQYELLIENAVLNSTAFGVCTFKRVHKKYLKDSYFSFFEKMDKYKLDSYDFLLPQHYEKGQKFHVFFLSDEAKNYIKTVPHMFDWSLPDLPENLTFFRNKKYWLTCISHEHMIILNSNDKNVMLLLEKIGVRIRELD